jgi:3-oxoacyl-[acyl-carrier protein] reductase
MDLGLTGKAAAVMAASEGLGRASALALAREGCDVAICGRREDALRATAKQIADESGRRVVPVVADVTKAHDVERFVNAAAADLRGLDVLVVNAGGPPPGRFEDFTDAQWQAAFDLTFMSAVRAVRAALPHFRAERGGSVVAIQSTSIRQPIDNLLLSNSLRMGVAGLFKSLATQYAPEGIRFNLVLPGTMATERSLQLAKARAAEAGMTPEQALAERARPIPLGRLGQPDELADAVAFLASDRARYITGVALQVDGGIVRSPL